MSRPPWPHEEAPGPGYWSGSLTLDQLDALDGDERDTYVAQRYRRSYESIKAVQPQLDNAEIRLLALLASWTIPYGLEQLERALAALSDDPGEPTTRTMRRRVRPSRCGVLFFRPRRAARDRGTEESSR